MPSKLVIDRDRSARAVDAVHVHLGTIAEAAAQTLSPHLRDGEVLPDLVLLGELHLRRMMAAAAVMVEADDRHLAELADDPAARDGRDHAVDTLATSVTELRQLVTGLYGPEALATIRLAEAPGRDPLRLQRAATDAARTLPSADLGPCRLPGVQLDTATWAARLDSEAQAITTALERVAIEGREAEHTLAAKNEAIEAFDEAFSQAAGLLTLLLDAAGKPELAARVKPSGRKPGRRAMDEEGPSNDG